MYLSINRPRQYYAYLIMQTNILVTAIRTTCIIRVWETVYNIQPCTESVFPSHAGIVSIRLNITKLFSPTSSHTILVFPHQTLRKHPNGVLNAWVWKIAIQKMKNSYTWIRIRSYIRPTHGCHFVWPRVILSDLAKYSMTHETSRGLSLRQLSFLSLNNLTM